jgi:hypothetical protein
MNILNIFNSSTYKYSWDTLLISILISLLGAIIGHFRTNGSIQMPVIIITYKKPDLHKINISNWFYLTWYNLIYLLIDFLLFLVGIRIGTNKESSSISIELGFLGDLLVGVGTGVLAFATIGITGSKNTFSLITTSLLAGFGGFSYIQSVQEDRFKKKTGTYGDKLNDTEVFDEDNDVKIAESEVKQGETQVATHQSEVKPVQGQVPSENYSEVIEEENDVEKAKSEAEQAQSEVTVAKKAN